MTREEEIINKGIEYTMNHHPMCIGGGAFADEMREFNRNAAFEAGAKWADSCPVFYKGQTRKMIDTEVEFADAWFKNHNESPTFADAIEWEKKRMIEKAIEWLKEEFYITKDRDGYPEVISSSCYNVEELIEDFRKAMEK